MQSYSPVQRNEINCFCCWLRYMMAFYKTVQLLYGIEYELLFELNLCVRFCIRIFPTIVLPFRAVAAATCCALNMRQPYFEKTVLYSAMYTVLEVNSIISISPKFLLHVSSLNIFYWKLCYHSHTKPCMQRHGKNCICLRNIATQCL